jgi:pyridoxamine 5'-phosphate oxidase
MVAFARWLREAEERSGSIFPNAVCLSTVDGSGHPQGRMVLLKGADDRGFVFFTNYGSAKGRDLDGSPRAALTFYWDPLGRQLRARGGVERVPAAESDEYFRTRPRGSQLGAWASRQSEPLESREALEARVAEAARRYEGRDVPRPPHWGGFLLRPDAVEFWQEGQDRLHDRILYRRRTGGEWTTERLFP